MRREEDVMRESRVGVGVIGVGGISSYVHLPGLRLCPQAEIVALCDTNEDLARSAPPSTACRRSLPITRSCCSLPAVDAVVVATPTVLHAPIALAAIAAGKHVLVEKQLAMNYAEARRMYQAAEARRRAPYDRVHLPLRAGDALSQAPAGPGRVGLPRHVRVARFQDWPEDGYRLAAA